MSEFFVTEDDLDLVIRRHLAYNDEGSHISSRALARDLMESLGAQVAVKAGSLLTPPVDPLKGGEWDYTRSLFLPGENLPLGMLNSYRLETVYFKGVRK